MVAIKKATTIEQQISLLQERGMVIVDIEKAKEYLLDIGYYRLGFYWFPFEKTYPNLTLRNHYFNAGTTLENAIKLYYFDFDVRNILQKYIYQPNRNKFQNETYILCLKLLSRKFYVVC